MTEPVSLADIKLHLVLDPDDTGEDAYLSSMIAGARRACELRTNRSIIGETRTLVLDRFPPAELLLTASPQRHPDVLLKGGSVTAPSISYFDDTGAAVTLAPSSYFASLDEVPSVLRPVSAWPATAARPDAVTVSWSISPLAGADLDLVSHAIRLIVGHWYANREAVIADQRGTPAALPMSVDWILAPLRIWATD